MRLRKAARRFRDVLGYDTEFWRGPVILGAMLAALTWLVWYFTKMSCTVDNAASGLCNPNVIASFINVDIMSRCTAAWLGATTLTGGINAIMLNRERERTDAAERQLAEERKRFDEERKRFDDERRRSEEERSDERRRSEERIEALINQATAERQAMMAMMAELTSAVSELRQQNNGSNGAGANGQS